jgi:hypothetical protein
LVYALAAAGSSCGDLVRCTLGDGVSLCPQRCAAMAQDAETPSTQQLRLRRVLAFLAPASMLGIEVLEVKFMSGALLRRIYRIPECQRHRGGCSCGSAPRAAGKAPVGSATSCSAPPKARRRTERRSYATDTCAYARRATEAASHGKHPTPGQGAAVAAWRTTSTGRCASART